METNSIGLDALKSTSLSNSLNTLLANFQLHYQNLRGFHWNIKGSNFFELHVKFEEYYTDAAVKIDEVAERILTLGDTPLHSFSDYLANSDIQEKKGIVGDEEAVTFVVNSVKRLLEIEREILEKAGDAGDEGTVDLLTGFISQQEKESWMLRAWLNKH